MALYGIDFYGASRYGPRVFLSFDAHPMTAQPRGQYGQLEVTWTTPTGNWSILRLVRNSFGVPVDQEDGVVLVDSASGPAIAEAQRAAPVRRYLDTLLEPGRFQYYAVWLYVPAVGEWTRAAETTGLVLKDWGYSRRLWELTPSVYRTKTEGILDNTNTELQTFLKVFGAQLDSVRGEYETLREVNNPYKVSGNLLPLMAKQYGQLFEPELGMKQMRDLVANAVYLYRWKGTVTGVEATVAAVSGFGGKMQAMKNLMLDYNQSSFEESISTWGAHEGCTLSRYVSDATISSVPPTIGSTMRAVGLLRMVVNNPSGTPNTWVARAVSLAVNHTANDTITKGVPVVAGTTYTVSAYTRPDATPRGTRVGIHWYRADGTWISGQSSMGAAVTSVLNVWTRLTATAAAPAGAAYAAVELSVYDAANLQVHYWDAVQFEVGSTATAYEDARLIDLDVIAPRVNYVTNPNFETSLAGYRAGNASVAFTRDTTTFYSGTASGAATVGTTLGNAGGLHDYAFWIDTAFPEDAGWFAARIRGPVGRQIGLRAVRNNAAGVTQWGNAAGDVSTFVTATGGWQRVSVYLPFFAGSKSVHLRVGQNSGSGAAAGDVTYVDEVQLEKGNALRNYFDGSTYAFVGDSLWEGAGNLSRSHYYPQRRAKNARLGDLLRQYTPMGSSYRLNYAQLTSLGI